MARKDLGKDPSTNGGGNGDFPLTSTPGAQGTQRQSSRDFPGFNKMSFRRNFPASDDADTSSKDSDCDTKTNYRSEKNTYSKEKYYGKPFNNYGKYRREKDELRVPLADYLSEKDKRILLGDSSKPKTHDRNPKNYSRFKERRPIIGRRDNTEPRDLSPIELDRLPETLPSVTSTFRNFYSETFRCPTLTFTASSISTSRCTTESEEEFLIDYWNYAPEDEDEVCAVNGAVASSSSSREFPHKEKIYYKKRYEKSYRCEYYL
ncbi:hypothetical protein JTE90_012486 [Oedothorax gibbosus]|uniref:Uncharacterized protein n=1 Tax=Oedothorax gibbosus TaxID=931172 RepID=A0AAV6U4G9_9ARAC|nr:hypothetical protein JTE90_012486 [Oedothorax gibbosus]